MKNPKKLINNENGATIIYVAIILGVLVMFTALAIDVNHLYGVRNELQNAADAGALAGARLLISPDDGTIDGDAARQEGARIGGANKSGNQSIIISVDECDPGEECDVEVGHWSFTTREFTRSEDDQQYIDWETTSAKDLDTILTFINAVKVTAKRTDTPSFFARIFGYDDFSVSTEAVAYIGFAGTIPPEDVDQPIAICEQSITDDDGDYSCNVGRMIRANTDTAAWTNFVQTSCSAASNNSVRPLICANGNPETLFYGKIMQTTNGQANDSYKDFYDCWILNSSERTKAWNITLPVIACVDGQPQPCSELLGAVNVNVVWVNNNNDEQYKDVPTLMDVPSYPTFTCERVATTPQEIEAEGKICWDNFVEHFNLQDVVYDQKTIYFLPDCSYHKPVGLLGGENYGIMAEFPKLVK